MRFSFARAGFASGLTLAARVVLAFGPSFGHRVEGEERRRGVAGEVARQFGLDDDEFGDLAHGLAVAVVKVHRRVARFRRAVLHEQIKGPGDGHGRGGSTRRAARRPGVDGHPLIFGRVAHARPAAVRRGPVADGEARPVVGRTR
jgi:hypothetical protein